MKKNLISGLLIILAIIIISFIFGQIIAKIDIKDVDSNVENSIETSNKTYNISKPNEISEYIPRNITEVKITNYLSDMNSPTSNTINDIDSIEDFMNLLFSTSWQDRSENDTSNFNDALYQIDLIGDTTTILKMQGIGGMNSAYGIVQIENNHYYISREIYQQITNFNVEKYYLHDSNLEKPSQEECSMAQEKALSALSQEEKDYVQTNIRYTHTKLEYELIDAVRLIKDSNSPYWEEFTTYGTFTEPFTGTKVDNGGRFIYILDELAKIKDKIKEENAKNDLQRAYDTLQEGMKEHNLGKCFEAHKIIHDYDYWVINTPVHLDYEPADWEGVTTYFGKVSILKY